MNIKEIWKNLWECLYPTTSKGFSIKNVMAAIATISLISLTFRYTDTTNLVAVLVTWLAFISTLMGLRTYEKKSELNETKDAIDNGNKQ